VSFKRPHTWPEGVDPPVGYPLECSACGFRLPSDAPPKPLCPGGRTGQSDGLSPVSDTNSGRSHQRDEALRDYVRRLPCAVCGDGPPSDLAHVKSWEAGNGDWIEVDGDHVCNLVPMDRACHRLQHQKGIETFGGMTGIDLAAEARATGESYLAS